jgi:ABC-type glycerol-3-phosphate transport system permease component
LKKTEIDEITFKEILKDQKREEDFSDMELVAKGRSDAYQNYDGYKPAAVGSFVAGVVFLFIIPIVAPILLSVNPPSDESLGMTNPKLKQNPVYSNSYANTAHSIKSNKVWSNFGYGVLTFVGAYVGAILIAIELTIR